jgi:hypothetical protein
MPTDSPTETVTVRPRSDQPAPSSVPSAQPWEPGQAWVPDNAWPSQPEPSWQQPAQPGYAAPGYPQQAFGQQGYGQAGTYPTGPAPVAPGPVPAGPGPSGGRQPRWPVVAGIVLAAVLLGGGAGGYILVAHPFSHSPSKAKNVADSSQLPTTSRSASTGPAAATTTPAPPATPVATPSPSQSPAEQQAASAVAGLLSQSVSDRSAINQAYNDVSDCGSLLGSDQQTFQQAASSRQSLITRLSSLPGAQSLPAAMLSDLTGAWQASEQVDQDYAQWAGDENTQGCANQDYSDPSYEAAVSPNEEATSDKTAFVALWNPIAEKYGLPTYSQGEI